MELDWITDAHKEYLSYVLKGNDDEAVIDAAVKAAYHWGLDPGVEDPTDEELSSAESATFAIVKIIRDGLEDGSVKVGADVESTDVTPKTKQEIAEAAILDAFYSATV